MQRAENRLLMVPAQQNRHCQVNYNVILLCSAASILQALLDCGVASSLTIKGYKKAEEPDEGQHGGPGRNADVPGQVVGADQLLPPIYRHS